MLISQYRRIAFGGIAVTAFGMTDRFNFRLDALEEA
jgi:hypothetical protein